MPGKISQAAPAVAPSKVARAGPHADAVREHLSQIIASSAFKGSKRSQEFLHYIVDKALLGQVDALKERVLGVELFGRHASYDTSEDAIVRVTASDLRRRLHQFYADSDSEFPLRIELHSGSYIPEFRSLDRRQHPLEVVAATKPVVVELEAPKKILLSRWAWLAIAALAIAAAVGWWNYRSAKSLPSPLRIQPWAAMFQSNLETRIVYCDPEISLMQHLMGYQVSLSDYANRIYAPGSAKLSAETKKFVDAMRGTKVAYVDASIALNVADLASSAGRRIRTHPARALQLLDFKTDDSFILLGSPRSNPWFRLFEEKLDFRFEFDSATGQEIVVNARPRNGELARYLPTAQGGGTGQAYAILAFLPNPGQKGNVMLIAGSNAEATEASGRLATNLELLTKTLTEHGVTSSGAPQPFEVLLRVATMAGSPNTFEVIAFHKLDR